MRPLSSYLLHGCTVAVFALGIVALNRADASSRDTLTASVTPARSAGMLVMPHAPRVDDIQEGGYIPHAFHFTRGIYTSGGRRGWRGGGGAWATDYPKADLQFLTVLRRLTNIDAYPADHAMRLDDPELRRYPFLYMLEVGRMQLTPEEANGLRGYLLAGGFAFIDDFWGTYEWENFEWQMQQVFPEYPIVELPLDHPIFNSLYEIRELLQVPSIGNARWGVTYERDGYVTHARAMFDDTGRLMMLINWNTDLGDAWEWAEQPDYPLRYSTFAYQMGANAIVYSMSH